MLQFNDALLYTTPVQSGMYKLNNMLSLAGMKVSYGIFAVSCLINTETELLRQNYLQQTLQWAVWKN